MPIEQEKLNEIAGWLLSQIKSLQYSVFAPNNPISPYLRQLISTNFISALLQVSDHEINLDLTYLEKDGDYQLKILLSQAEGNQEYSSYRIAPLAMEQLVMLQEQGDKKGLTELMRELEQSLKIDGEKLAISFTQEGRCIFSMDTSPKKISETDLFKYRGDWDEDRWKNTALYPILFLKKEKDLLNFKDIIDLNFYYSLYELAQKIEAYSNGLQGDFANKELIMVPKEIEALQNGSVFLASLKIQVDKKSLAVFRDAMDDLIAKKSLPFLSIQCPLATFLQSRQPLKEDVRPAL